MTFRVRPAGPDDTSAVVEFNRRLAWETEAKVLDPTLLTSGVSAVLADPIKGRYFVAEASGVVVGQVMITYEWSDWRNGWIWWLQSVYVRDDWRRRGVFRGLIEFVFAEARREAVVGVRLYVEEENAVAQETYRGLGFEEMHFRLMGRGMEAW